MTVLSVANIQKTQQNIAVINRRTIQLSAEQRRLIDNFRPTRQEINAAYAKARQKVENDVNCA